MIEQQYVKNRETLKKPDVVLNEIDAYMEEHFSSDERKRLFTNYKVPVSWQAPLMRYVFTGEDGKRIFKNRLLRRVKTLAKKLKLGDNIGVHTLRHTFASHLVMKGVDLATIKQLLGHSDIETTMIYSHLTDDHVDRAVEKLNF